MPLCEVEWNMGVEQKIPGLWRGYPDTFITLESQQVWESFFEFMRNKSRPVLLSFPGGRYSWFFSTSLSSTTLKYPFSCFSLPFLSIPLIKFYFSSSSFHFSSFSFAFTLFSFDFASHFSFLSFPNLLPCFCSSFSIF